MSSATLDLSLNPINLRDIPFGEPMVGKTNTSVFLVSVEGTKTLLGIGSTANGELGAINPNSINTTSLVTNNAGGFSSYQSKISIIAGGENMFGFVYENEGIVIEDEVYTWGKNNVYQLGFGGRDEDTCSNLISRQAGPGRVDISDVAFTGMTRIRTLQMGYDHSHIITKNNRVFSWGNNYYGQLGISQGVQDWSLSGVEPIEINPSIGGDTPYIVYGGKDFSVLLTNQGNVYAYGRNDYNQLGISDGGVTDFCDSPVLISISDVHHIAVGQSFAVALKTDGTVWGWGDDTYGQISLTSSTGSPRSVEIPTRITDINNAIYLTAGINHFAILQPSGKVRVVGDNRYYQSSDPPVTNIVLPFAIGNNTFYVEPDGDLWGYGAGIDNSSGLLGNDVETATTENQVSMLDIQSGVNINLDIRTIYGPVLILAYNLTPFVEEKLLLKFDEDQTLASSEYMEQKKAICFVRDIERNTKSTASDAETCCSTSSGTKPVIRFRSLKEQLAYEKGLYILDKKCLILN